MPTKHLLAHKTRFKQITSFLILCLVLNLIIQPNSALARSFEQALPGFQFHFPRDHASHENYKTEWWYYTGHLNTANKKTYGFELTFFRIGQDQPSNYQATSWRSKNIYSAHFAITDENSKTFHFYEKLNREGLNLASAREDSYFVSNESWFAEQLGKNMYIKADTPEFGIHLLLEPKKDPVVHGHDGVSQKASCKGCASHYYSMTRLQTTGLLFINGKPNPVSGLTWMDHEFGSNQLTEKQVGWDWYSIQLENNMDIMLYVMRNADGTHDKNSSGTIIYPDGKSENITLPEFKITAQNKWKSPATKGEYPMGWHINIPRIRADLVIKPSFPEQELVTSRSTAVTYWEGACNVTGKIGEKEIKGLGYVEMTGYAERFKQKI